MKTRNLVLGFVLSTLLAVPALPQAVSGQTLWNEPEHQKSIGLELAKPFFADDEWSSLSSVMLLAVNYPFSESFRFVGEIPFAYGGWEGDYDSETDIGLGNPYLGLGIGKEAGHVLSGPFQSLSLPKCYAYMNYTSE